MRWKVLSVTLLIIAFLPLSVFATIASSSEILNGIDVSNWQGYIDYREVKNSGIDVVYIKTSQGNNIVDAYFRINYNNAKANGLKVGFYHFLTARTEQEALQQADFFASVISNTSPDCKLAMDFEEFGDLNIEQINSISETFLERLKQITGKEVIIYSDAYNAKATFGRNLAEKYPLWIAEYGAEAPSEYSDAYNARATFGKGLAEKYPLWIAEYGAEAPNKSNWEYWEGFQYTSQGRVSGIQGSVDRDKFTNDIFLSNTEQIVQSGNSENYNQDTAYIVQSGNTLSGIAVQYGTTVAELVTLNKIQNPNLIFPGERICVPIKGNFQNEELSTLGHRIYTVVAGDTLSELALRFRTTVENIAKLNDIENINLIYIGETLKIPRNSE